MRTIFLVLLLLLPAIASGQAVTIDLYTGEVPVASQDSAARRRALPQALEHVFQKLSGLSYFEDYPQIEPALGNASSILLSFHYKNEETVLADGSEGSELRLVANFSETKVDEMVQSLQLPLWKPDRPPLDIWVVVDDGVDRRTFPLEFSYAWRSMGGAAAHRGLNVRWPVPDEEGQYQIDAQLLWGGYTEDLGAGQRGGVMISAARREGLEWSVRNNVSYNGEDWTWRVQDIDLQAALTQSMQQAVDRIAAANTIAASELGLWGYQLTIDGLGNAQDYQRCLAYLQGLSVVNHVSVISAGQGNVVFKLELSAVPQYLEEALGSGKFMELNEDDGKYFLLP